MIRLHDYQINGAGWLSEAPRARMLADDMGLGKSATAITACDLADARTINVIAPAMVRDVWKDEWPKWASVRRKLFVMQSAKDKIPDDAEVVIASYEGAVRSKLAQRRPADLTIFDEAHYLKERFAKRTRALLGKPAQTSRQVFWLTGTPIPNHPGELYPFLAASGAWTWGYRAFEAEFLVFAQTAYGQKLVGIRNEARLRELLGGHMLRRVGTVELPPVTEEPWIIEAAQCDETAQIRYLEAEMAADIADALKRASHGGGVNIDNAHIATLRRLIGVTKATPLGRQIKAELDAGKDGILIFAHHKAVIAALADILADYSPLTVNGETPPHARRKAVKTFMSPGGSRVMIAQLQTAGTGITLTQCNEVVMAESSWTPANNLQAVRRCHRIGQTRPVRIRYAELAGSVDQQVTETLRRKIQIIDLILNS